MSNNLSLILRIHIKKQDVRALFVTPEVLLRLGDSQPGAHSAKTARKTLSQNKEEEN